MKLHYERKGDRIRAWIEISSDEYSMLNRYFPEDSLTYLSDRIYLTRWAVASALGVPVVGSSTSAFFLPDECSQEIIKSAGLDLTKVEHRKILLSSVYKYLKTRIEIARAKEDYEEREIPLVTSLENHSVELDLPSLNLPLTLSIGNKIYELKPVNTTLDMSEYIKKRLRSIVRAYRQYTAATLSAYKQEYQRKLEELERYKESIFPMPPITIQDLKEGVHIFKEGSVLFFLQYKKITIKRFIYKGVLYTLAPEYQGTCRGLLGLALDRRYNIDAVVYLNPKNPYRGVRHPNVSDTGTVCLGESTHRIIGKTLGEIHEAYLYIDRAAQVLSTVNFDDAYDQKASAWSRRIISRVYADEISQITTDRIKLNSVWSS